MTKKRITFEFIQIDLEEKEALNAESYPSTGFYQVTNSEAGLFEKYYMFVQKTPNCPCDSVECMNPDVIKNIQRVALIGDIEQPEEIYNITEKSKSSKGTPALVDMELLTKLIETIKS